MKIGVNLWFLTLIIAIIKVSFTKRSGYKVSKLHLPSKQASFAIEAYFIWNRRKPTQQSRLFLSIVITKFCMLVNLESSNENREFWASQIPYFLLLTNRIPYSCTTIKLQSYDYIGYNRTIVELQLYNYRGYSRTTIEFLFQRY